MKSYQNGVHDPTIIKEADTYYLVSTDTTFPKTSGVPIRSSKDLIHWEFEGTALDGVPKVAKEWSQAVGLWAPEIIKVGDEFRMYYSASTFGSTTSMIGLATSENILGPWTDQGEVVKTNADLTSHNAIDANISYDREGEPWMVYGSFFGGIYILPINQETGKSLVEGYGKQLAIRSQIVDGAIEGPFIYYHQPTDYYYLFVSFDSLNDSYNIRVARSKEIDGPYVDMHHQSLIDLHLEPNRVGTKLLGSYQWRDKPTLYAPGHNSIFVDDNRQTYIVHHARRKPFSDDFFVQVRPLFWLEDGWPVVGPEEFDGKVITSFSEEEVLGNWEFVSFNDKSSVIHSQGKEITRYEELKNGIVYKDGHNRMLYSGRTASNYSVIGKRKA